MKRTRSSSVEEKKRETDDTTTGLSSDPGVFFSPENHFLLKPCVQFSQGIILQNLAS